MPTLWFMLHDLPMGEPSFDVDAVYRYLVPPEYKSRLRAAGATGGVSAAVSFLSVSFVVSTFLIQDLATSNNRYTSFFHSSMSDERSYGELWLPYKGLSDGMDWVSWRLRRIMDSI